MTMAQVKSTGARFVDTFWRFPLSILARPFKNFEAMKFEKRGSYVFAFFVLFLECMLNIGMFVYNGFLINYNDPYNINSLFLALTVLFPVALFVVGNWCITTLMDGKGRLGEIFQVTMYAMFPMCLMQILAMILSNLLTLDEMVMVFAVQGIGALVFVVYLFVGIVVVHEYTFSRGVGSMLLTVIAMMVLVFILMLVFSLAADVVDFFTVLTKELMLKYM